MAISRKIGLAGIKYRGGGPMIAWVLHRISGLGIILLVGLHVLASFSMQQTGSDLGTALNTIYESPWFQLFIYFCVLFHTINGTRIIILDSWPKLLQYQREFIWLEWLIFLPVYGLAVYLMVQTALSGG